MHTQTKILAALLMVTIIALTTTATLGYFIYERTLSGLVTSRFEYIATELKRKVETGLDLGLPMGELENVNELLRQEILTDNALLVSRSRMREASSCSTRKRPVSGPNPPRPGWKP